MAKIDVSKILGKSKTYTVDGTEVSLTPLKGKDMDLLLGIKEGQEAEGVKKLIMAVFEFSQEEWDELPITFINDAAKAIMDINGLDK